MSRLLRILVIAFLSMPGALPAAPQRPPVDCVICGQACCCPEMCAPLIEKMQREKTASADHCAMEPAAAMGCAQEKTICQIQPKTPFDAAAHSHTDKSARPRVFLASTLSTSLTLFNLRSSSEVPLHGSAGFPALCLQPPRRHS